MRELSLFTGAGGGLLGTHGLLGWQCVGAVEFVEYPCRVLRQRQKDGILNDFPIWNMDIREFNRRIAPAYTGMVDVISAGFPCQPFSVAGKQRGADDERNMWPATIECIRVVRPRYAFLENVPGLLNSGYFGTILADLQESGYSVRWRVLSAAEVGAPHKRDRLWILGYSSSGDDKGRELYRGNIIQAFQSGQTDTLITTGARLSNVADANSTGRSKQRRPQPIQAQQSPVECSGENVADANKGKLSNSANESRSREGRQNSTGIGARPTIQSWWKIEPDVGRVAHRVADRVDRLKAIGNGQVPAVAATAWHLLTEDV